MSEETSIIFPPESQPDLPVDRFLDRELSWLEFNARVLAEAERVEAGDEFADELH